MEQLLSPLHPPPAARAVRRPAAVMDLNALARIARVAGHDADHGVLVALPGVSGAKRARLLKGIRRRDLVAPDGSGREVLVVFDHGRLDRPIIVGVLQNEGEEAAEAAAPDRPAGPDAPQACDERVLVEALSELALKCGASSITLRRDGKIVLRGTHLLSRSSGPIRIKGGHVEIN